MLDVDNCFLETRNLSAYIPFMCWSTDYVDKTMRVSEADVLINAVKTFVLFWRTNVAFLLKVQNKMDPQTRQKSKEGCNWYARNGVVQLDFPVNRNDGC